MRSWAYAWGAALLAAAAAALAGYDRVITWTWDDVARVGPWVLIALAVLNTARTLMPAGSLIGPMLLAGGAASAFVLRDRTSTDSRPSQIAVGALLVAAWVFLRLASGRNGHTVALLWVTRRRLKRAPRRAVIVAVLGVVALDMTSAAGQAPAEIVCLVLGGRVELAIPESWRLEAAPQVTAWSVQVRDDGPVPGGFTAVVLIRLLGIGGGVGFARIGV